MLGRRCCGSWLTGSGLTSALAGESAGGRRRHLDAAVLRDLAVMLADGGDCLSDLAALRDQPELFGPVASTPTAWRVIERTAKDPERTGQAARRPGPCPRPCLGCRRRSSCRTAGHRRRRDLGAGPSDAKQGAAGTYKRTFGFHPLLAYLDRGPAPGEPLAGLLRPGNAPAGGADDLIELVDLALAQLPAARAGRCWSAATAPGPAPSSPGTCVTTRVGFSLGMPIDAHLREAILAQPEPAWTPAIDADGQARDGAEVCELTGWIDLHTWPEGTRVICRREDAHPGAQLRFSDHDGHRFQVFLTDQPDHDLARLELRHRQRARVEDRIRAAKATGLANLPFDRWRRNTVWLELVLAAQDLTVLGPGAAAGRCARGGRAQDPALPAAPRRRADRPPRPPHRSFACNAPGPGRSSSPGRSLGCGPCRCAAEPPEQRRRRAHPTTGSCRHAHPAATGRAPPAQQRQHRPGQPPHRPRTPLTPPDRRPHDRHPRPHEKPRLDTDAIGDLRPDLVLSQDLCAVCAVPSGHVNQALDVLGCQAEVISLDPSSLDEVLDGVLQVGKAAGAEQRAEEVVAGLRERLASVQAVVEGLERPWVFALEWGDPPFNGGHWVPEMLQVAGGEALLACPGAPSVRVTWAQIEAVAPQVVVFMPCGYGLRAAVDEASRTLLARPELAGVEAIIAVDASAFFSRPGPRLVDGVEILAAALHPGWLPPPPAGTAVRLGPRPHR